MNGWWKATAVVLAATAILVVALYVTYDQLTAYFQGIAVEAGGVLLEVILLLVVIGGYEQFRARRAEIARLRERIDDVKRIDDAHARGIIASSIRGLGKLGLTDVDLRGAHLSDFSFDENDIKSLKGAVLAGGMNFDKPSTNRTRFKNVVFTWVNCSDAIFGSGQLSLPIYEQCSFWMANLAGAKFDGATLKWDPATVPADEANWFEQIDTDDDGAPILGQVYSPAFHGADLAGCSFRGARLSYADFREAKNVEKADFTDASGLDTCFFDVGKSPAINA